MLFAYGCNTSSSLSSTGPSFLSTLADVADELGVGRVLWAAWGGSVGLSGSQYKIWGFAPSSLHLEPCPLPPTVLDLPAAPRAFAGSESLEGFVCEDGYLWVPDEQTSSWRKASIEGGWLDVKQLGSGAFLGLHRNDPSTVVQASSIHALSSSAPPARDLQAHIPRFAQVLPGSSHALLLPTRPDLHPPHAVGSNLHSQLARPMSSTSFTNPMPIEILEGLGEVAVGTAGVHNVAVTRAGEVYVWGGIFGVPDGPLDLSALEVDGDEHEEGVHVVHGSVAATGGLILQLEDGRVVARGVNECDLLPTRPTDGLSARKTSEAHQAEWEELPGSREAGQGRTLRELTLASGGRGWFLRYG